MVDRRFAEYENENVERIADEIVREFGYGPQFEYIGLASILRSVQEDAAEVRAAGADGDPYDQRMFEKIFETGLPGYLSENIGWLNRLAEAVTQTPMPRGRREWRLFMTNALGWESYVMTTLDWDPSAETLEECAQRHDYN